MAKQRAAVLPLAVLFLLGGTAGPAAADWLVTKEGAKVETQGPWTVKGKLVVFKTPDGKLSSLRVADVDLDASRNATEEAVAAQAQADAEPEKPAPQPKKAVRSITDKDVRQAGPAAAASPDGSAPAPTSGPGVVVDTWKQDRDPEDGHVVINGTLANASGATAAELQLKVMLYDDSGSLLVTNQAALALTALPPGEKAAFRADFPGYFSFATLKFEPQSRRLATRPADQPVTPRPDDGSEPNGG